MTTVNITTSTGAININNNTDQTINPNPELLNNKPSNVYIPTKVCKTCRTIKYITEFYKDKSRYDGYSYICTTCKSKYNKEYLKEYYEQNKEKLKEYNKEHSKEFNKTNRDTILERHKEYREQKK